MSVERGNSPPSPDTLRKLLRYEPETGKLFWRDRPADLLNCSAVPTDSYGISWNLRFSGKEAFATKSSDGYLRGGALGETYLAHRVIWTVYHGKWPDDQIDHINGNREDNRIENLREVDNAENGKNRRMYNTNTSGFTGVCWDKRAEKWRSYINLGGCQRHLGHFNCRTAAMIARKIADKSHGFHDNHGKPAND